MICTAIPVFGREALLRVTIERLYYQADDIEVFCIGDGVNEKRVCEETGAHWIEHKNYPLGAKWQTGLDYIRDHCPECEAFLYIGSSDWVSDNWTETMIKHLLAGYDMAGKEEIFFLDIAAGNKKRMLRWPGYMDVRMGETIGTGRLISRGILDKLDWQLFDRYLDNTLDASMQARIKNTGGRIKLEVSEDVRALSISTDRWPNHHIFNDMVIDEERLCTEIIPVQNIDPFLREHFPEAINLFGEGV